MSVLLQQVIVGLVAVGAAVFVVRRIVAAVRPGRAEPTCDACAMNDHAEPHPPTSH